MRIPPLSGKTMLRARTMNDPVHRLARAVLAGAAPVGVAAWARHVVRDDDTALASTHALADDDGQVIGTIRAVRRPLLGPGAPTVLMHRNARRTALPKRPAKWRGAVVGLSLAAVGLTWNGHAVAQVAAATSVHLQSFDRAWTIIHEQHFDTTFNGVDWVALRDELRPRAAEAVTRDEVREVIRELLARLGQSHFALIPEEAVDPDDDPTDSQDPDDDPADNQEEGSDEEPGDVGFDVRLLGDDVVVTSVEPETPASQAGIAPGWVVTVVDERPIDDIVTRVRDSEAMLPVAFRVWNAVIGRLSGDPGSAVDVAFLDGDGDSVSLSLVRRHEPSEPVRFGSLPTFFSRFASSRVQGEEGDAVGVVWFNFWMVPLIRQVDSALFASRDADGMVVDLRGNRGGVGAMVIGVAGHFFGERVLLGTFRTRTARLDIRANPRRVTPGGVNVSAYAGPVAVLVDETSASASEVFAGGIQSVGRARVFGSTTAGAVLPAVAQRLPNDDVLYSAFAEFTTATGTVLEGRGVVPDELIRPTREDLLAGRDVVMEAAVRWIHEQRSHQN